MDWMITIPKKIKWSDYEKELEVVKDRSQVMLFKVPPHFKSAQLGERCYVVYDGKIKGWMHIEGLVHILNDWTCSTTGKVWSKGRYLQRSGPFYPIQEIDQKGFQGIRRVPWTS